MQTGKASQPDPIAWCIAIAVVFFLIALNRLGLPTKLYFDEIHYVPAARKLLEMIPANREHPLFGKEILAASIHLFGDRPMSWRLPALAFGTFGLFAFSRLLWLASGRRFATIAGTALLATDFTWFVQSRIAMLDIFAASLAMGALWQFAAAIRYEAPRARLHMALSGVLLGLALGSKWSTVPIALAMGLGYLFLRLRRAGSKRPAIKLLEAAFWLGLLPLIVYWATFTPYFLLPEKLHPIGVFDFIGHHREMIRLQDSVVKPHPYQSVWYEWVINWRPIWYLYEHVDGDQRGIIFLGNPLTMLIGLPALAWSLWAGIARGRRDALAFALLYCACLAMWLDTTKPVLFYYHYLLPSVFLMGCLALAFDASLEKGGRWRGGALALFTVSLAMFAWFYPIISAAALHGGRMAFLNWMWLYSWR